MIYLDFAAATPVHPKALEAMLPYFSENFYNPSAPYLPAKHLRGEYEAKKSALAQTIGAKSPDLVITAGATESINLAFTVLENYPDTEALILSTEHASVRESARRYAKKVAEIVVDSTGLINLKDLATKITDRTVLVSVAIANNELGTIQPLSEIAEIIRKVRDQRLAAGNLTPLYLHSDASQAASLLDLSVARLGVDLLTLNSAKVYGPKGIGALYIFRGVKLSPISYGGGQEMGLRSGTENVPLLMGFAEASVRAKAHISASRKKYEKYNQLFRQILTEKSLVTPKFLGNKKHQLANFCPICFDGLDAERLIFKLEDRGILLSTGAACAASKGQKSHVLSAIGLTDSEITGSLRVTFGELNTEEQIREAATVIAEVANQETKRIGLVSGEAVLEESHDAKQGQAISTVFSQNQEVAHE